MTYCYCTCRALKDGVSSAFRKVSYIHTVRFIMIAHFIKICVYNKNNNNKCT
uniref:Uncharacterized protein n=1 Tax=Heterorhabditis bacteriophora TaxID=37862 RepID=A0A1I7X0A7_HETBA